MADMACGGVLVGRPAPVAIGDVQMEDYCIRCVHVLPPRQCAWVLLQCTSIVHSAHPKQCTGRLICRLAVWRLVLVAPPAAMDWRHLVGNSPTYSSTLAQPPSTQYYYAAHSTSHPPRPTERRTVGQRRRSAGSIFIRHHIPAKIVLHLFAEILKPPFSLEYEFRSWIKSSWIWRKKTSFLSSAGYLLWELLDYKNSSESRFSRHKWQ